MYHQDLQLPIANRLLSRTLWLGVILQNQPSLTILQPPLHVEPAINASFLTLAQTSYYPMALVGSQPTLSPVPLWA